MRAVTPWFMGSDAEPVREGRYQVRFCAGWREVVCEWRGGSWWLPGDRLDKLARVNLKRWPGFRWRGLSEPAGMLFLPPGANWTEVDADLHAVVKRYLEKAKLARASAKRYRARGDLVRWRKACAVAHVWEMAHDALWMVACPF
jgi:hypothetical protein